MVEALKTVRSCGLFTGRRAIFNLPLQDLSFFPVHFPFNSKEDPEEGILREACKVLSYPPEEAMIDYPSLFQIQETCHAAVVAARRQAVDRWLLILRRAGFTAEVMDFTVSSLIRLHRKVFAPSDRADILCHLGRNGILLAVITAEGILSISELSWGTRLLWEKIETSLALPAGGPETVKLLSACGLGYMKQGRSAERVPLDDGEEDESRNIDRVIFQIISPMINGLANECHNAIDFVHVARNNLAFGKVYLYGLGGLISHLDLYLEEQLKIPVQLVDLKAHLDLAGGKSRVLLPGGFSPAPALGLALREVPWL